MTIFSVSVLKTLLSPSFFIEPERHYIFEYAKEFGFLRLSPETRKRLKIPVKIVNLGKYPFLAIRQFNVKPSNLKGGGSFFGQNHSFPRV